MRDEARLYPKLAPGRAPDPERPDLEGPHVRSHGLPSAEFPWEVLEPVGEGATAVVWRAQHVVSGQYAALKVGKQDEEAAEGAATSGCPLLLAEAELVARTQRRWGPALLDVGRVPEWVERLRAGAPFVATEWIDGAPLNPLGIEPADRVVVAALVAHGVGRALAEIHDLGVCHGDVKPANILLARGAPAHRAIWDRASDRSATLIDFGLARNVGSGIRGGTPRYLAPEGLALGEVGPAGDLFALGLVLAEVLDPDVAAAEDPRARFASRPREAGMGPARWAEALVAEAPGGRPSAAWVAAQAARWLGLRSDPEEIARARQARVRRTYLAVRSRELSVAADISPKITGVPRAWLEDALTWQRKLHPSAGSSRTLEPLGAIDRARWLVALVGPTAAAWPMDGDVEEHHLADRLLALAKVRAPSSWTLEDVLDRGDRGGGVATSASSSDGYEGVDGVARLVRELARPLPDPAAVAAAEERVAAGESPDTLTIELASALVRAGDTGRAWAILADARGGEAEALRAEIARRRGDRAEAERAAERALTAGGRAADSACATLARLAWDRGDLRAADAWIAKGRGAAIAEVRALVAYGRGELDAGLSAVAEGLAQTRDANASARLEAARGMLEHARGNAAASLAAFGRAVELATRGGGIVEEATYLTNEAAAAVDLGEIGRALDASTRAALLWERLGRGRDAARAWLQRAAAFASIGAVHEADEAAEQARTRAVAAGDRRAAAYARWASVEVRSPGDARARGEAIAADQELADAGSAQSTEDHARAAARLLVWAPDAIDEARVASIDATVATMGPTVRWEWWGARAAALLARRSFRAGPQPPVDEATVLAALSALVDAGGPLWARGPALDAAMRLATERGDGDAARRFELARRTAARALREGTPAALRPSLANVAWARTALVEPSDVTFAPAQIAQLEAIVRSLGTRDRLRPLLEQVLDTMILWTGVERGLLLLRTGGQDGEGGRLVPRAARNLARRDLLPDQLRLSQGIARRAMETGDAVVATDAFSTLGDMHASVHALGLRSVLAVPLIARGETLGVVYLDDRARKGAFGERELAWVRVVASQAAMALADARDQLLLKRAVRRAERARLKLEAALSAREVELDAARAELERARNDGETRYRYEGIAGRSPPMRAMLQLVDRVTASDIPVLIVGESGTGKELVARAMHANGPRARRPFVSENCASVPETLLESTLFGHVRGAFTGASGTRAGLFDVADGGTLFLDEIGEMSLPMQAKLLRVLQDGEVRAVGSERTRKVDVRVIGATHRDLEAMVAAGTFREDLFYRLNVVTVRVPPLRERAEDVPLLVAHFIAKHGGGKAVKVTRAAMDKLVAYPWPGNVRQLENEIRRALVLCDDRIDVRDLSEDVVRGGPTPAREGGFDLRARIDALEEDLVRQALQKTHGNQTRAAQLLGISRFGLQKMIKRLKIEPPV